MNNVCLIGRLTKDPELRYIPSTKTAVTTFTLAVDKGLSREKRAEMEQKNQPTADFVSIVCWGKTAEMTANHLIKGLQVGVTGRIQTRSYDDNNGARRYVTEIAAQNITMVEWNNNKTGSGTSYDGWEALKDDNIPF
ncbi:MAG: single-stranded DNA-binding protein [Tissierellia bacterium]|nr:single-stranded DNA-binding protein [Tissierellia bacterium]